MKELKILVKVGKYWIVETDEVRECFGDVLKAVETFKNWSDAHCVLNVPLQKSRIKHLEVLFPDVTDNDMHRMSVHIYRTGRMAYRMPDNSLVWRPIRVVREL